MDLMHLSQYRAQALKEYETLLVTPRLDTEEMYGKLVTLSFSYPHFLPYYLEILEQLECHRKFNEYNGFFQIAEQRVLELLESQEFVEIFPDQSFLEIWATKCLLERIDRRLSRKKPIQMFRVLRFKNLIDTVYQSKAPYTSEDYLGKIKNVDSKQMQEELLNKEMLWYGYVARQSSPHHQHTQTIPLRTIPEPTRKFTAVDGPHESVVSNLGTHFPLILRFVSSFAEEYKAGLGRVALVRLKPGKIVYRHFDSDVQLEGRDRYHMALHSVGQSPLTAGKDCTSMREGELWHFNNMVSHKATNTSSHWRVHLIFDMHHPQK